MPSSDLVIKIVQLYNRFGLGQIDLQKNQERANQLISRGEKLLGKFSPEQIVNLGTRGIRAEINAALAHLRLFRDRIVDGRDNWWWYIPKDYEDVNETAKPGWFSEASILTDKKLRWPKGEDRKDWIPRCISFEGFQAPGQDVAESIYKNADMLTRLKVEPEEIHQALQQAMVGSQGIVGDFQYSPFGDGAFSHAGISANGRQRRIKPFCDYDYDYYGRETLLSGIGERRHYLTYSALIPFMLRFWYYTEGTGSQYHLPVERMIWSLRIGNHEQQARAYLEDLRQREKDLLEAKRDLTEALEGTGAKNKYGTDIRITDPFFGHATAVIQDRLIRELAEKIPREKKWKVESFKGPWFFTDDYNTDYSPSDCRYFLEYFDLALGIVRQRIGEEEKRERLRSSGAFSPLLIGGREYAHIFIPGDKAVNVGVHDYVNPKDLPKIKADSIWVLWLGPDGGIFFDLRKERYQAELNLSEATLKNNVTQAARRLLESGFSGEIRAKYYYEGCGGWPQISVPQRLADLAQVG